MVFSGARTTKADFDMAMAPERSSRTLHNFSLPCLKWGGQKHLRCVRLQNGDGSNHSRRSPPTYADFGGFPRRMASELDTKRRSVYDSKSKTSSSPPPPPTGTEIGRRLAIGADVEAVRKKLMLDLQTEMDKMKFAVLIPPPPTKSLPAAEERPWNLRTRRADTSVNAADAGGKSQRLQQGISISSLPPTNNAMKSPVRPSDIGGIKRPRDKFSIPLSKHEIEEDFIAITGVRPPRKPKKRTRTVQRQLDAVFPGLWLSEITPDMYKVKENLEDRKR